MIVGTIGRIQLMNTGSERMGCDPRRRYNLTRGMVTWWNVKSRVNSIQVEG